MGMVIGLFVAALRFALVANPPLLDDAPALMTLGNLTMLAIQLTAAFAVLHIRSLPPWAGARLALAMGLLSINRAISYPVLSGSVISGAALVTDFLGAVLLCATALALLRQTIRENTRTVDALNHRVEQVEAESRQDRERLHEINATIAGIASATRLIHRGPELPSHRKGLLQEMLDSEIARLERLMDSQGQQLCDIDLDEVIRPLVVAQHALGRPVFWTPSGHGAYGRSDDIAEVVNVLLNNAARHAPGAAVVVNVRRLADSVEIRVSDSGPGISTEMAARLFEWGAHDPESPGEGIGLHVARRLMQEQGGSLRPMLSHSSGAVFVVGLQPPRDVHESASARAE
jgi:signal transduction histidine kinase